MILYKNDNNVHLLRHTDIMFDDLRLTTLQLKNVHDLTNL
jgi:hypothetical protein